MIAYPVNFHYDRVFGLHHDGFARTNRSALTKALEKGRITSRLKYRAVLQTMRLPPIKDWRQFKWASTDWVKLRETEEGYVPEVTYWRIEEVEA